jgi:lipid-A-disaccharide synthase
MVVSKEEERRFIERGIDSSKIIRVGDLSLDSLEVVSLKRKTFDDLDEPLILFLPGSRPVEIEYMIPFYLRIVPLIRRNFSRAKFIMVVSPFISERTLKKILPSHLDVQIVRSSPYELMSISHLAITIPGTNNMQLACLGVPMVVILPLNRAELIPLDGIAGLVSPKIPPFGLIKRKILLQLNRKIKFVASPNIRAGKEIVPEIRGIIKPEEVAEKAVELLSHPDKLKKLSYELKELTRERGAKDKVVDVILEILAESEK